MREIEIHLVCIVSSCLIQVLHECLFLPSLSLFSLFLRSLIVRWSPIEDRWLLDFWISGLRTLDLGLSVVKKHLCGEVWHRSYLVGSSFSIYISHSLSFSFSSYISLSFNSIILGSVLQLAAPGIRLQKEKC